MSLKGLLVVRRGEWGTSIETSANVCVRSTDVLAIAMKFEAIHKLSIGFDYRPRLLTTKDDTVPMFADE